MRRQHLPHGSMMPPTRRRGGFGWGSVALCTGLVLLLPRVGWAQDISAPAGEPAERFEEDDAPAASQPSAEGEPLAPTTEAADSAQATEDVASEAAPVSPGATAEVDTGPSTQRVTAIALTGLAFVGVAVGTSSAILAVSRDRQAEAECTAVCTVEGDRLQRQSDKAAVMAQIAFAVGLVSLGGAVYAWLTEPSKAEAPAPAASGTWRFDLAASPGEAGAWLGGRF